VSTANGYLVTMANAGWAVGSDMALTSGTAVTVIATLISTGTGATSVGVVAVGGQGSSTSYSCAPATAFGTTTNLAGKGPTAVSSGSFPTAANVVGACPVDIVSVYSAAPAAGITTTTTSTGLAPASAQLLKVGIPVTFFISPQAPDASKCHGIVIATTTVSAITVNGAAGACDTANGKYFAPQTATSGNVYTWSFYVNTESTAKVCFQSPTQFAAAPGTCGVTTSSGGSSSKSSNILSVIATPLLLLSAILFN